MSVENNIRQSWLQMTSIKIGGAVCLPVIMVGQQLGRTFGFTKAAVSIVIGNFLLFLLGLVMVKMSFENRLTTIRNAENYFGKKGTKLFALNIIISLVGWFAIQLNFISLSVEKSLATIFGISHINLLLLNISLGIVITLASLRGIRALAKLANISMPLLGIVMLYALGKAVVYGQSGATIVVEDSFRGISLVLATAIMAMIGVPDFYRFSRSLKDSVISIFVTTVIAISAIELVGTFVAVHMPGATILETLTAHSGMGMQIVIALFLLFAGWTTNNGNLYSLAVTLEKIFPKLSQPVRILIIGLIGTFISCFNILAKFTKLKQLLSKNIIFPSY